MHEPSAKADITFPQPRIPFAGASHPPELSVPGPASVVTIGSWGFVSFGMIGFRGFTSVDIVGSPGIGTDGIIDSLGIRIGRRHRFCWGIRIGGHRR